MYYVISRLGKQVLPAALWYLSRLETTTRTQRSIAQHTQAWGGGPPSLLLQMFGPPCSAGQPLLGGWESSSRLCIGIYFFAGLLLSGMGRFAPVSLAAPPPAPGPASSRPSPCTATIVDNAPASMH